MNKFGLMRDENDEELEPPVSLSEKLAAFPASAPKHRIDIGAMDAAAAPHGFVSREATGPTIAAQPVTGRRRRLMPAQPTRHLAIRLTVGQYDRFVSYADRHKLTYHDALGRLLERSLD